MKCVFYCLCPLPAICLYLSTRWPNGTIGGIYGPHWFWFEGSLWAIVLSACLTFWGFIVMFLSPKNKISVGVAIATIIAAIPGIIPFLSYPTD